MYIPDSFEITDRNEIHAFIQANSFGQLISSVDGRLFSSHLPFQLSDDGRRLCCHMAKANPQWPQITEQEILVTFQGPHAYISPSWYHAPGVPTWNYQALHIYGRCQLITDPPALATLVDSLASEHESHQLSPWSIDYSGDLLKAIIGLDIEITGIECKYKLSQNRPDADRQEVMRRLFERGEVALADAMRQIETGAEEK